MNMKILQKGSLSAVVILMCLPVLFSGCGKSGERAAKTESGTAAPVGTENVSGTEAAAEKKHILPGNPVKNVPDADELMRQIDIFLDREEEWGFWAGESEPYYDTMGYAVTDLDHNGRTELIVAFTTGTGYYSENHIYEINEAGDGFTECKWSGSGIQRENNGDFAPDLMNDNGADAFRVYYDKAEDRYHYICENVVRSGGFYNGFIKCDLTLKNGKADIDSFVASVTEHTWNDKTGDYDENITYETADGKVSEEKYLSAEEDMFGGMEKDGYIIAFMYDHMFYADDEHFENKGRSIKASVLMDSYKVFMKEMTLDEFRERHFLSAAVPEQYQPLIEDWTLDEEYSGGNDYLKMYFGDHYGFDSYALDDVNGDGIPELFLYGSGMYGIAHVYTVADDALIQLGIEGWIGGINKKESAVIVTGHWHGAGGSNTNEYEIWLLGDEAVTDYYYIDELNGAYSINHVGGKNLDTYESLPADKKIYDGLYEKYVKDRTDPAEGQHTELSRGDFTITVYSDPGAVDYRGLGNDIQIMNEGPDTDMRFKCDTDGVTAELWSLEFDEENGEMVRDKKVASVITEAGKVYQFNAFEGEGFPYYSLYARRGNTYVEWDVLPDMKDGNTTFTLKPEASAADPL
ncbi:hypothetical protein EI53_01770 [Fusobacterium naviforme]|nr:hypothetical protein F7P78_07925 [Fusobacterium naviforme]PSL09359.1 hypothetical protein EI53_01770 [Fusobacterium naviforme]STO27996.1 Uncharacterised protein [Fusobacterium naviforme]